MKDHKPTEVTAPSVMAIAGHPIHPMLITFPIAYLIGTLATDLSYWWTMDPFWAKASFWLVSGGLIMGALAAVVGMFDFLIVSEMRQYTSSWSHFITAIMVLSLASLNLVFRLDDPEIAILPWGLFISAITAFIISAAGWLGGKLVFEHNIGPT